MSRTVKGTFRFICSAPGFSYGSVYKFVFAAPSLLSVVFRCFPIAILPIDAVADGVSRFIFWLVNNLPNRVLGAIGLVLILIASFLQFASPLIELLNITGK